VGVFGSFPNWSRDLTVELGFPFVEVNKHCSSGSGAFNWFAGRAMEEQANLQGDGRVEGRGTFRKLGRVSRPLSIGGGSPALEAGPSR
jgi:hypothetical protein